MPLGVNMTLTSKSIFFVSDETLKIFEWVFYSVMCQTVNIFGIVTNIINIICFLKQGFEDVINISLLGLAVSDLGSLITMVWTCISLTPAVVAADLPYDSAEVLYLVSGMPHFTFIRISSCITAMITLERCLCITAPLQVKSLVTSKRTKLTIICIFLINVCGSGPVYFVNTLTLKFYPSKNITIVGIVFGEDREIVEKISFTINSFSIPICAFVIITVCTATLSLQLRKQAKWRILSAATKGDTVPNRNMTVAKMVVMIGAMFIVCFSPLTIAVILAAFLPSISINGEFMNLAISVAGFCYILESVNSSMNIFIYYRMSSKYRLSFRKCILLTQHKKV